MNLEQGAEQPTRARTDLVDNRTATGLLRRFIGITVPFRAGLERSLRILEGEGRQLQEEADNDISTTAPANPQELKP